MMHPALFAWAAWLALVAPQADPRGVTPDPKRVEEIAGWLAERPQGVGPTADDREAWAKIAPLLNAGDVGKAAEKALGTPTKPFDDELYLDFSRTGNRTRYEGVYFGRWRTLNELALAEAFEGRGRFLPAIEKAVEGVCADRTWVLPAHDRKLDNFHGKQVDIDLFSSAAGWTLATVDHWMGGRMGAPARKTLRENLDWRIVRPIADMLEGKRAPNGWLTTTNNWNAVCWANVAGTVLAAVDSRPTRALVLAGAEKNVRHFRSGITPDGWCSEGMGYWNYGFGRYMMLADLALRATEGRLDLLADPHVAMIASFGRRAEIVGGRYPSFADCNIDSAPGPDLLALIDWHFSGTRPPERSYGTREPAAALMLALPYRSPRAGERKAVDVETGLRTWFADAGVLVCRPAEGVMGRFGVALKGGHNAEHHNHNDVGSYSVILDGVPVLADPGSEVYQSSTFDHRRYESPANNSFGHPVPRIAGKLQVPGRKAQAKVLEKNFAPDLDTIRLDVSSCYDLPTLKGITRTFAYSRAGNGGLTITDAFQMSEPGEFETALVTYGKVRWIDGGTLEIIEGGKTVRVTLEAEGGDLKIDEAPLEADYRARRKPVRVGIAFAKPPAAGSITVTIVPQF
jgi:hypothetical protein